MTPTAAATSAATPPGLLAVVRWFPLVPRPRPVRAPLEERLSEIRALITTAPTTPDPPTTRAVAWNNAALLASDHHRPDLARRLCWQHHHRYRIHISWNARTARLALEPLINLARLHLRDHHPDAALATLTALRHGIDTRTDTTVDERPVTTSRIIADPDEHHLLRTWIWSVLLAEGIRGLARTGRWADALTHAHRHHGVGQRLLDGRQTAVIAPLLTGDRSTARRLLDQSDVREPWERAIASTLGCTIDLATGALRSRRVDTMVTDYLAVNLDDRHTAFIEQLGRTIIALTGYAARPGLADPVHHRLKTLAAQPRPIDTPASTLEDQLLAALRLSRSRPLPASGRGCCG